MQGRLGDRIGSLEALACAVVVGATAALVVLLVARRSLDGLRAGFAGIALLVRPGVHAGVGGILLVLGSA